MKRLLLEDPSISPGGILESSVDCGKKPENPQGEHTNSFLKRKDLPLHHHANSLNKRMCTVVVVDVVRMLNQWLSFVFKLLVHNRNSSWSFNGVYNSTSQIELFLDWVGLVMSRGCQYTASSPCIFLLLPPFRSWTRSQSTESKSISYLTPILMRTRSSKSRPEFLRWGSDKTTDVNSQKPNSFPSASWGTGTIHPHFLSAHPHLPGTSIFPISVHILSSDFISPNGSSHLYLSSPGKHSFCCDWLQPADWGEGKEDPWPPLPLGSGWSWEPGAQWLPQTTYHACVSLGKLLKW